MGFDRDEVVLAELDMPSTATVNAQLNDLLQPGGERVGPAAEYEARDASGTIRVTVDARRKLTDVDIQQSWASRIPAAELAGVLFGTYVTATQRAVVVELANTRDAPEAPRPADLPAADLEPKPHDEWIAGVRARISEIDAQLDDIRRLEASQATPELTDVRSPLGFFVLHLRGGSPAGVTGSAGTLPKAGASRLRQDFLEMFSAAGLAATSSSPKPRSARGAAQEDDEDAFEFRYDV
ncbi:hypothetical protein [Amycolatopsis sp. NPDC051128]|uniref:hypothetical protein n=1 Tax=Amycolatopsis sp. NPDC051128 TaxID=3155412 RepID=UPI00343DBE84